MGGVHYSSLNLIKSLRNPIVWMRKRRCQVRCPRLLLAPAMTASLKLGSH